jgi:hypothetical protein
LVLDVNGVIWMLFDLLILDLCLWLSQKDMDPTQDHSHVDKLILHPPHVMDWTMKSIQEHDDLHHIRESDSVTSRHEDDKGDWRYHPWQESPHKVSNLINPPTFSVEFSFLVCEINDLFVEVSVPAVKLDSFDTFQSLPGHLFLLLRDLTSFKAHLFSDVVELPIEVEANEE